MTLKVKRVQAVAALVEGLRNATPNDEGDNRALLASWPKDLFLRPRELLTLPLTPTQKGLIAFAQLQACYPEQVASGRSDGKSLAEIFGELAAQGPDWLFSPRSDVARFPDHVFAGAEPSPAMCETVGHLNRPVATIYRRMTPWASVTPEGVDLLYGSFGNERDRDSFAREAAVTAWQLPWHMAFTELPPHLRSYIRGALKEGHVRYPEREYMRPAHEFRLWAVEELDRTTPARLARRRLERAQAAIDASIAIGQVRMEELGALAQLVQQQGNA